VTPFLVTVFLANVFLATVCLASLAAPAVAAPRAKRLPLRKVPAQPQATLEQQTVPGGVAPSAVSLRLQLGLGGGQRVVAGRAAGQLDVWQTDPVGIGLLAAATAHVQTNLEASRSFTLIAPVLSLRGEPSDGHFRGALALGLATWSCEPGPCDEEGERGRSVVGGELMVGYALRSGAFGWGWHAGLALLPASVSGDGASFTLTVNFDLGAEL
jgi:hypothetical protein